jgi:hypothetical protein
MSRSKRSAQTALLEKLYGLKQKQLQQASQQTDSLLYRVLSAEADAITDALKTRR